ncbi:MAG: superoxide dismutase family protein [Actinomycetota bacterium]
MSTRGMRIALVIALAVLGTAIGVFNASVGADDATARAVLHNAAGDEIGVVKFIEQRGDVLVKADDLDFPGALSAGFKGFHVHATGVCDPAAIDPATGATVPFLSAGGHYNPAGTTHASHGGDMPVLQVNADGSAWSRFRTDHFDVEDIIGRAVIVHANADNFGNVPVGSGTTQYTANSTGTTNATATGLTANTGNAGPRYACGVIVATR